MQKEEFKKLVKAVSLDVKNMGSVIKWLRLLALCIILLAVAIILLQIEIWLK